MVTDLSEQEQKSQTKSELLPKIFLFTFEADLTRSVPLEQDFGMISAMFRHFNATPIEIGCGGSAGALNLGFRLCHEDGAPVFEDRASFSSILIEPGQWVACQLRIPREVILPEYEYQLYVDLVREEQYWFSALGSEPTTISAIFTDAINSRQDELVSAQIPALEESLTRAFSRISELEHAERALLLERDDLRARFDRLNDSTARALSCFGQQPTHAESRKSPLDIR